jgi:hypothetical protein
MAVTLAETKNNATTDMDLSVIDEFRKESALLDALPFDDAVNPSGGGGTLVYGYRRLTTQAGAAFRAIGSEYVPGEVVTTPFTVELKPLGGSFDVDRVTARVGAAASGAVALNLAQKIKATRTKFQDEVINGDTAVDANGFNGLDKALVGTSTEFGLGEVTDWRDFDTDQRASFKGLDALDEWLSSLDGAPTMIFGNKKALARVRALARRSGMYTKDPIDDLLGANGRPVVRESYGGVTFVDPGEKAGSATPIIPIVTRTVATVSTTGLTDLYAVRMGLDGFHGVSMVGGQLVQTWLPDFSQAGAVKRGEVEMGPVAVALKATKAATVFRNIRVQ